MPDSAFDAWYNEIEGFALRAERLTGPKDELMAAFEAGRAAAIEALMEAVAGKPDVGLTVVRIDTTPNADGWCFCTPRHHPDDIRKGLVDEEWQSSAQMFAKVIPFEALSPSLKEQEEGN